MKLKRGNGVLLLLWLSSLFLILYTVLQAIVLPSSPIRHNNKKPPLRMRMNCINFRISLTTTLSLVALLFLAEVHVRVSNIKVADFLVFNSFVNGFNYYLGYVIFYVYTFCFVVLRMLSYHKISNPLCQ